jgi:citrate synthase
MYGAVTAGIAALAGPLHGGANTNVMKMLKEIGSEDKIDSWLDKALKKNAKLWASVTPSIKPKTRARPGSANFRNS